MASDYVPKKKKRDDQRTTRRSSLHPLQGENYEFQGKDGRKKH
jgi:hypothetical protein